MENITQQLPPLTPQELSEDGRKSILACNATVAVLATLAIAARFWARRIRLDGYGLDDYLIAAALVVGWGLVGATIAATNHGLGQHWQAVLAADASSAIPEGQAYLASGVLFAITIALVKISSLLLYIRGLGTRRSLLLSAWIVGAFTITWSVVVILVSCLQCRPIAAIWDQTVEGSCINSWLFFVITATLNTITDLILLVLPVPALMSLRVTKFERYSLVGIFLVGIITCIVSFIRLIALIQSQNSADSTWNQGMVAIWTAAEPCLGIIAISLPTMRPFFSRSFPEPPTPPIGLLPDTRTNSAASSRRAVHRSFDWASIELVKSGKWLRECPAAMSPQPMEGVIEVRTTWETRHSYRRMSGP